MRIQLQFKKPSKTKFANRIYGADEDDILSILTDVCRAIEHQGDFFVSGFGQDRWSLDIGTDLCVFLEQLPDALRAINNGKAAEIDFYEQGIERLIIFSPVDDYYVARCVSGTDWQPNPMLEELDRASLEGMLLAVRDEFMRIFSEIAPGLVQHPWVRQWLECTLTP